MPSTLITTVGAANANAYVSLAVANQYHEDRSPKSTLWEDADDDAKNSAILWATKLLDRYYEWNGYVVDEIQRLLWPRQGLYKINEITPLPYDSIPEEIQWATAEYASQVLVEDLAGGSEIQTSGIRLIKAGSIRVDFDGDVYSKPVPDSVTILIPDHWGRLKVGGSMIDLKRS